MTIRELAMNLIEHSDTTPSEISIARASEIIGWLDPDTDLPDGMTPEDLCNAWNEIIRKAPHENLWT